MAIVINGSGTVTGLSVGGLPDGTVDEDTLAASSVSATKHKPNAGSGAILQVLSATQAGTTSTTSNGTMVDVSGMSVAITPTASSSKILVTINAMISIDGTNLWFLRALRGSTVIGGTSTSSGTSAGHDSFASAGGQDSGPGSNGRNVEFPSFTYLDSPSTTSATTYKLQWCGNSGDTIKLNQWGIGDDASGSSSITVMEIA